MLNCDLRRISTHCCFIFHLMKIATSVVYHEPFKSVEFLLHYFVARELNIAYAISRHFEWSQNIVFFEELPGSSELNGKCTDSDSSMQGDDFSVGESVLQTQCICNTIILSSADGIVPSAAIDRYLNAKYKEGHRFINHLIFNHVFDDTFFSYAPQNL